MRVFDSLVDTFGLISLLAIAPVSASPVNSLRTSISENSEATSGNWAGAILEGSGLTSVVGTFTVPNISIPQGGSDDITYGASVWVGIDGDSCESGLLQAGVNFDITGDDASFTAWYEWFPDVEIYYDDITISAGDTIQVTVVATSTSSGTTTLENLSTGVKRSHTFMNDQNTLCFSTAEWIVEDYTHTVNGVKSQMPFVDYGSVKFTNAYAYTDNDTFGISNAKIDNMIDENDNVLSRTTVDGDHELTVTREYP